MGSSNEINLDLSADRIRYNVIQTGNENRLLEYSSKLGNGVIQRSVLQAGNNNNLIIHGSNSLSDKMTIQMNGGITGIVIRNFN